VIIIGLAIFLRFYRLDGSSLWSDEGNTWAMLSRPMAQIAHDAAADIHPPGYYWLLKGWSALFGRDALGMRSFSALAGVLLVWVIYQIGLLLGGSKRSTQTRWLALLAALLAALNPFQVYYSQEARMYILLALESAGLMWATLRLIDPLGQEDRQLTIAESGPRLGDVERSADAHGPREPTEFPLDEMERLVAGCRQGRLFAGDQHHVVVEEHANRFRGDSTEVDDQLQAVVGFVDVQHGMTFTGIRALFVFERGREVVEERADVFRKLARIADRDEWQLGHPMMVPDLVRKAVSGYRLRATGY